MSFLVVCLFVCLFICLDRRADISVSYSFPVSIATVNPRGSLGLTGGAATTVTGCKIPSF